MSRRQLLAELEAQGRFGFDSIDDTVEHTGRWASIVVVEQTVFQVLTPTPGGVTLPYTVPAGATIAPAGGFGGYFTNIQLTSGKVWAYRGAD